MTGYLILERPSRNDDCLRRPLCTMHSSLFDHSWPHYINYDQELPALAGYESI